MHANYHLRDLRSDSQTPGSVKLRSDTGVTYAKVARMQSDYVDKSVRHILGSERDSGEITPRTTSPRGAYGIGRQIHSHTAGSPYCLSYLDWKLFGAAAGIRLFMYVARMATRAKARCGQQQYTENSIPYAYRWPYLPWSLMFVGEFYGLDKVIF
jgi:hypothetical protein